MDPLTWTLIINLRLHVHAFITESKRTERERERAKCSVGIGRWHEKNGVDCRSLQTPDKSAPLVGLSRPLLLLKFHTQIAVASTVCYRRL